MANLGVSGMQSLQSINQWIGLIDTNLTNTKRIGYKETRISLKSGELSDVGKVNTSGVSTNINIPSATLQISGTEILDKVQGNLTPTDSLTDFALDGEGYFVVEDQFGMKYATRDGQFHFDNDGFLVTSQGLKVLSSGQDWIRVPASEHFLVDENGRSQGVVGQSNNPDYIQSLYGTRKLMVIQIPQNNKLYYSKYGFTTFELGKNIPVNLNNNFKSTMDGLNPDEASFNAPPADANGFYYTDASNYENKFKLYGGNSSYVEVNTAPYTAPGQSGFASAHALVSSHTFTDFGNSMQFRVPFTNNFSSFGFTFGLKDKTNSETLYYVDNNLGYSYRTNPTNAIMAGVIADGASPTGFSLIAVDSTNVKLDSFGLPTTNPNLIQSIPVSFNNNDLLDLSVIVNDGKASVILKNDTTIPPISLGTINFNVGKDVYSDTYQSVGTLDTYSLFFTPGVSLGPSYADGLLPGMPARVRIENLQIKEYGTSSYYGMDMVGTKRSNPTTGVTNGTEHNTIDPDSDEDINTQVKQQYVEESTTTVADALPELSNAQKVFSAISKIISMSNSISDDMNNLIR